jgi:hypothetical protein
MGNVNINEGTVNQNAFFAVALSSGNIQFGVPDQEFVLGIKVYEQKIDTGIENIAESVCTGV